MRYNVITIEREYASGGNEVGEILAEKLGIPCYGQEILEEAAARLNVSTERIREVEESITGSMMFSLAAVANLISGQDVDLMMLEQRLTVVETEIIRNLTLNPCVLVGRGASALLPDKNNILKIFIYSDFKTRVERAINVYGVEPKQAESVVNRNDKRRANYFRATTEKEWKGTDIYHMCLNSGKLGIDQTVDILYKTII